MSGERRTGAHDITGAEGGKDGAVIPICRGFPFRAPTGEEKARARGMQIVDAAHQARHVAGFKDQSMEASIGFLPGLHVGGMIASPGCFFGFIEDCLGYIGCCVSQGHCLQCGAHTGDLPDLLGAEARNPHTAARFADRKALRLQPAKGFAYRDMTGAKLRSNMILTQPLTGRERARYDAIREGSADPVSQSFFGDLCHEL